MIILQQNTNNSFPATVSMNVTISNPVYLFEFQHKLTNEYWYIIPYKVPSAYSKPSYDLFNMNVDFSLPQSLINNTSSSGNLHLIPGEYLMRVYQQTSTTNLDPLLSNGQIYQILVNVDESTVVCQPEPPYEGGFDDEWIVYDDCLPTPVITASVTPNLSPTQTSSQTPTPTPTYTPTQTSTPTETPTQTPTQTASQTPTQTTTETPTQTPSQTPTFTPTQTETPTQTPTQTTTTTPTPTPSPIPVFCIDNGFDYYTAGSLLSTGGTMYVFGELEFYDNNHINKIARINQTSALLDASFNPTFPTSVEGVYAVVEDSNGNLFLGGSFTSFDGAPINRLVKIDNKGNRIQSFYIGTGFNGNVRKLILDEANNELYVAGAFTTYTGQTNNRLIKLNATTGEKITTFNIGTGFNGVVNDIVLDGSGGLYVGGAYTTYTGATNNRLTKLNATTAAKDTSFVNTTGLSGAANKLEFYGGNLYVGGAFTQWKGVTYNRFIKIDPTGTVDATYNTTSGFNGNINAFAIDSSGRAICVGATTSYSGVTIPRIARLNTNATLDTTFNTNVGTGFVLQYTSTNGTQLVNLDGTGNIYIAGGFTSFDGEQLNNFVKLDPNGNNITFNNCAYPAITPTPSASPIITDADALAYVNALNAANAVGLTDSVKSAINTLFVDLKNAGVYSKLYALYPMVGEISAPMRLNALNPLDSNAAYRLSQGTSLTFSKKGVSGFLSVINQLDTNFNPTTVGVTLNNFSLFSFITVSGTSGTDIGGASLNAWMGLSSNITGNFQAEIQRSSLTTLTTGGGLGFQAVSRVDASNVLYVKDTAAVTSVASAANLNIANVNIFIGAYNGVGSYTNRTLATTGMAQGLNSTELANLRDAINTFETSYNR